jgi:hypothetical protein
MLWSGDYEQQAGTGQKGSGHKHLQDIIPAFISKQEIMEDIRIDTSQPNQTQPKRSVTLC